MSGCACGGTLDIRVWQFFGGVLVLCFYLVVETGICVLQGCIFVVRTQIRGVYYDGSRPPQ